MGTFGAGLLPQGLEALREEATLVLNVLYEGVTRQGLTNVIAFSGQVRALQEQIRALYESVGVEQPPLNALAFWAKLRPDSKDVDADLHIAYVRALLTPLNEALSDHIRYRLAHRGNLHFAFTGPTGFFKSTCAVALANWMRRIEPATIGRHLAFDLNDLPRKIRGLEAGEVAILDEYLATAGVGAKTGQAIVENLEDTLRGSQVSVFRCSPRRQEEGTMQATFEAIGWNPHQMWGLFLVWVGDWPAGVVAVPAMPGPLYESVEAGQRVGYAPWKEGNVARSKAAEFGNNKATLRGQVLDLVNNAEFVEMVLASGKKPTKKDFEMAAKWCSDGLLSTAQLQDLVHFTYTLAYRLKSINYEARMGVPPSEGMLKLASRCVAK